MVTIKLGEMSFWLILFCERSVQAFFFYQDDLVESFIFLRQEIEEFVDFFGSLVVLTSQKALPVLNWKTYLRIFPFKKNFHFWQWESESFNLNLFCILGNKSWTKCVLHWKEILPRNNTTAINRFFKREKRCVRHWRKVSKDVIASNINFFQNRISTRFSW